MTDQPQLWTPSVEALHLQAFHHGREGWEMRLVARRSGWTWPEGPDRWYDGLSTPELADVVGSELERLLGL